MPDFSEKDDIILHVESIYPKLDEFSFNEQKDKFGLLLRALK